MANSSHDGGGQSQRRLLEQNLRTTISSLTHHLTALGKSAAPLSHTRRAADLDIPSDRDGVRIITLTGSNKGAAMKIGGTAVGQAEESHGMLLGDEKAMGAYANSNYQAISNSVLLGGSCTAEDPGVHISFLDFEKEEEKEERGKKKRDQKGIEKIDQSIA